MVQSDRFLMLDLLPPVDLMAPGVDAAAVIDILPCLFAGNLEYDTQTLYEKSIRRKEDVQQRMTISGKGLEVVSRKGRSINLNGV